MKAGTIVEYIDKQKIICSVVMEEKSKRLRLLTENDREVNQSANRISFESDTCLDISVGRDSLVRALKDTVSKRKELKKTIDLKELWELLNEENEWIDLVTMTEYCFPKPVTSDQKSAVIRAFFESRLYFKFDHKRFFPNSVEHVEKTIALEQEEKRKRLMIEKGGAWLKSILNDPTPKVPEEMAEVVNIIKSYFIYEKESRNFQTGKEILAEGGISSGTAVFKLLVKLGVFTEDENLDIYRMEIPWAFSDDVVRKAEEIERANSSIAKYPDAEDYTHVTAITIDGQSTTDYDDALSIEKIGESYVLGIHISDVARFIEKNDTLDRKALSRGASIYMADRKIPMLPSQLSENICSLVEGELRPCISVIVTLNRFFEVTDYEVAATQLRVDRQLSYSEAGIMAETDTSISTLIKIAKAFREKRLRSGATHITLPEVNVFLDDQGEIVINRVDRESPARMMVAEMMIMGNWLMAGFLARNGLSAIFRSQHEPKERLYKGESDSLFLNCLQRKFVSRAIISHKAGHHSGLGLDAYVTATSPIRRYYDLVTQRQIKAALGLMEPYSDNEITQITQMLDIPMGNVGKIQFNRRRYWLLKYLESKNGTRTEAVVLDKRKNSYTIMLTEYMLEYHLPAGGLRLKPQDLITVVIQHANARKDAFSVFMG